MSTRNIFFSIPNMEMPTNLLVKNLLSCAQNNDKTISFTTMMKTEVSDSDCHAYQTTLGRAASYYDLNLSLETGEFNRRLKLFDIEQGTNPTACVPLQPNVMERKLWPTGSVPQQQAKT